MKLINLLLIGCIFLASQPFAWTQTQSVYKADLIVSNGKHINTQPVEISIESNAIKIRGKKKSFETKLIPLTGVESVDYTFSDRPRYTAAALSTLALGIVALPLFASKTKKNWLTINAEKNSAILQLQSSNYRTLLLEMHSKGIKISDSGDRDEKDKNQKNAKEGEKYKKPVKN